MRIPDPLVTFHVVIDDEVYTERETNTSLSFLKAMKCQKLTLWKFVTLKYLQPPHPRLGSPVQRPVKYSAPTVLLMSLCRVVSLTMLLLISITQLFYSSGL